MTDFNTKRTWGPTPAYPQVLAYRPKTHLGRPIVIAGPCSIEDADQVEVVARKLAAHGVTFMRGGVFRAGTYPKDNFGLKRALLRTFSNTARRHGLKTIVEVIDVRQLDYIDQYADAFQVGARQGQGYVLLKELAKTKKPVTLKRGAGMKLDEFLGAAEYLARGRCMPILIERGGASFMDHVRWELSTSLIAAVKQITKLPIIVDASHGSGRRDLVQPLTLAGIAAGADGFLVEVHPCPEKSISDTDQAFPLDEYPRLLQRALAVRHAALGLPVIVPSTTYTVTTASMAIPAVKWEAISKKENKAR